MKKLVYALGQSSPVLKVLSALCTEFAAATYILALVSIRTPFTLFRSLLSAMVITALAIYIEYQLES